MIALADINVALRRRKLDAGCTEFFLNGKVEIAPGNAASGDTSEPSNFKIDLAKN